MSTDPRHFDRLYADSPDPWHYETSGYEAEKYAACLALLPEGRFASGLEIGCSIGVLSAMLAERCTRFLGLDVAAQAVERARARDIPNAEFRVAHLPGDWPEGSFDLIVLSEVLYFFDADALDRLARRVAENLSPGGTVLMASYLGETETELDGAEAQAHFAGALARRRRARPLGERRDPRYVAQVFELP